METDPNRVLRARLSTDLRAAMQARDRARMRTIRDVMSAIDNAEAVEMPSGPYDPSVGVGTTEVPRDSLDASGIAALLAREVTERTEAASQYRLLGHAENAAGLETEAAIIQGYRDLLGRDGPTTQD